MRAFLVALLLPLAACASPTADTSSTLGTRAAVGAPDRPEAPSVDEALSVLRANDVAPLEAEPAQMGSAFQPGGNAGAAETLTAPPMSAAGDSLPGRFVVQTRGSAPGVGLMSTTGLVLTSVLNQTANDVNSVLRLPVDISMHSQACGEVNAYYSSSQRAVTFCDEFADYAGATLDRWVPEDQKHGFLFGALEFVALHEIGHALVDQYGLTVYNQSEDVADLIATFLALETGDLDRLTGGMVFWAASARDARALQRTMPFWGEHSFDEQRMASIACLYYGADPVKNKNLAGSQFLPLDPTTDSGKRRLALCERDFQTAARDLRRQLLPFVQPHLKG